MDIALKIKIRRGNRNNIYQYAKLVKSINLVIIMQRTNTHYTLSVTNTFKYFSHLLNEEYQTQLFYAKYKNQILFWNQFF